MQPAYMQHSLNAATTVQRLAQGPTSSSRVWIQPRSRSMRRRERMWRSAAATMPGTPATVSRNTIRSSHLPDAHVKQVNRCLWCVACLPR